MNRFKTASQRQDYLDAFKVRIPVYAGKGSRIIRMLRDSYALINHNNEICDRL